MEMTTVGQDLKLIPGLNIPGQQANSQQRIQSDFGEMLRGAISDVNTLQLQAGKAVDQMVSGQATSIHDVMISVEKAKTSFELLMQVRNQTIDMYHELMRMQI